MTDEDIIVDNNYGQFQLGADLRVIGTAAAPALSGRAELREGGQLFVGRNIYTITSGTIDFANPTVIEPNLNIELTTRAGGEDIEVTIAGTQENLGVSLESSSDPDLGQADLTALLVTGLRLNQLNTADAAVIGAQVLGNFSADVLGFAGRAIGLDTLRIGGVQTSGTLGDSEVFTADLDPTSRLTFGKGFGSNLDVTFSQSLRDGDAQTWIVDYLLSRQIELRLVSNDDDLMSYGFRHDMSFGGTRRATSGPLAPRREDPRVTSVMLAGDLIVPDARLREVLSLVEGDRFDFTEWQRDRDRVEAFYHAQNYLTARVTATRMDTDGGIALTYSVMPGSRTEIVIQGTELPAAVMAELRRAWAESVFENFLVDEATDIVRRALAREGYLQAEVSARFTEADGTQTLAIDVVPGLRTAEVTVQLYGVEDPLREQLSAEVALRRLADRAATDPEGVARELTEYLRTQGYLGARVSVDEPPFSQIQGAAIVPIRVTPGEPIVIGTVGFDGVMRLPPEQVRETAALPEGIPADPAVIELARERIVALHRREGFASVTVTTRQVVRTGEPRLDVTFAVMEGPRQVLSEVAVSGNRSIDTDVIERALGLMVNQPLRPEEWLQARTRVFDTGLFRRVDVSSEPIAAAAADGTLPMRMRVVVEEWPALRARYGLQVAEERPEDSVKGRDLVPGLSGDITRRTLFGRAATVGGAAGLQRRERLGRVFFSAPTMMGLPVTSSFIVERARRSFASDSLVTDTSSAAWEQRMRVTPRINVSYAYRIRAKPHVRHRAADRHHRYPVRHPHHRGPADRQRRLGHAGRSGGHRERPAAVLEPRARGGRPQVRHLVRAFADAGVLLQAVAPDRLRVGGPGGRRAAARRAGAPYVLPLLRRRRAHRPRLRGGRPQRTELLRRPGWRPGTAGVEPGSAVPGVSLGERSGIRRFRDPVARGEGHVPRHVDVRGVRAAPDDALRRAAGRLRSGDIVRIRLPAFRAMDVRDRADLLEAAGSGQLAAGSACGGAPNGVKMPTPCTLPRRARFTVRRRLPAAGCLFYRPRMVFMIDITSGRSGDSGASFRNCSKWMAMRSGRFAR